MLAVISRLVTVFTTPEKLRSIVFQSWEAMSPPPSLHILLQQVCILVVIKLCICPVDWEVPLWELGQI
jgi:hypothetical protein